VADWSSIARRIRVPLGFAFAALYLWLAEPTVKSLLCGVVIAIPGLLLRALASGHLQKNEQLAMTGPYAYTRNPLYLGSMILAAGFAVAGRNWWIAGGLVVIFAIIYLPVMRSEETFLCKRFPEYTDYARRVPMLWPRLAASGGSGSGFSRELYWKHREYNAALGSLAMMAALAVKLWWASR